MYIQKKMKQLILIIYWGLTHLFFLNCVRQNLYTSIIIKNFWVYKILSWILCSSIITKAAVYNGTSTGLEKLSFSLSPTVSYPGKFTWPIYSSLVYMQPCEIITDNLLFLLIQSHLQMTTRYIDNIQID